MAAIRGSSIRILKAANRATALISTIYQKKLVKSGSFRTFGAQVSLQTGTICETQNCFLNQPINCMKKQASMFITLLALAFSLSALAQDKKPASPPAKAEGTIDGIKVTVDYAQPSAKGRKIMGELVPFGEVWRTGANAVTAIEFSADAKVEGKALPKGKYGLFTIPGESEWVIIFSKQATGSPYDYSDKKDALRVNVKPGKAAAFVETFTIAVEKNNIVLTWENTTVAFKVTK
jgi:Protein of unknown function (DUF2911)